MKRSSIDILNKFLERDNFGPHEWKARGLVPSSPEITKELNLLLVELVKNLIDRHNKGPLNYNSVLEILNKLTLEKFDTEERELFIDKLVLILSQINFEKTIEEWLGIDSSRLIGSDKPTVITKQKCQRCKTNLITWILKTDDLEYPFWEIGECNECGKLQLIKIDKATSFQPKSFEIVKSLRKTAYTEKAALNEIERIEKKGSI